MHYLLLNKFKIVLSCALLCMYNTNYAQFYPIPLQDASYRTSIDVMGKHLSGILIFREQDNHVQRIVMVNEMGVTFFDVSIQNIGYTFHQIMHSLDKKSVKRMLAKDLGMLLQQGIFASEAITNQHLPQVYTRKLNRKGYVVYEADTTNHRIKEIQNWGKKKVISIYPFYVKNNQQPDSISIQHHTFDCTIILKKIYATE